MDFVLLDALNGIIISKEGCLIFSRISLMPIIFMRFTSYTNVVKVIIWEYPLFHQVSCTRVLQITKECTRDWQNSFIPQSVSMAGLNLLVWSLRRLLSQDSGFSSSWSDTKRYIVEHILRDLTELDICSALLRSWSTNIVWVFEFFNDMLITRLHLKWVPGWLTTLSRWKLSIALNVTSIVLVNG